MEEDNDDEVDVEGKLEIAFNYGKKSKDEFFRQVGIKCGVSPEFYPALMEYLGLPISADRDTLRSALDAEYSKRRAKSVPQKTLELNRKKAASKAGLDFFMADAIRQEQELYELSKKHYKEDFMGYESEFRKIYREANEESNDDRKWAHTGGWVDGRDHRNGNKTTNLMARDTSAHTNDGYALVKVPTFLENTVSRALGSGRPIYDVSFDRFTGVYQFYTTVNYMIQEGDLKILIDAGLCNIGMVDRPSKDKKQGLILGFKYKKGE